MRMRVHASGCYAARKRTTLIMCACVGALWGCQPEKRHVGPEAPVTIAKSQIVSRKRADTSLMPDLSEALTQQQIRDIVAFLQAEVR